MVAIGALTGPIGISTVLKESTREYTWLAIPTMIKAREAYKVPLITDSGINDISNPNSAMYKAGKTIKI
jgi:hypothetical protein